MLALYAEDSEWCSELTALRPDTGERAGASNPDVHPGTRLHMVVGNTREVIAAVASFEVDVGFVEGAQTHPELDVLPWLVDELVIVCAPTHALAGRRIGLRELREALWVLREQGCQVAARTYRAWRIRRPAARTIGDAQAVHAIRDIAWTIKPDGR